MPEDDVAEQVLMRFTGGDDGVLSGLMRGAAETRRRPAIIDTPVGKGRVVAFATNPCYRWQNHGEFGMLFNAAVLFWNDVPDRKCHGVPCHHGSGRRSLTGAAVVASSAHRCV